MNRTLVAFLVSMMTLAGAPAPAHAATPTPNFSYHYQRLFYYRDGDLAKASLFAHASSIDIFAPQVYQINADGTLSGSLDKDVLAFAKAHKLKIMPLVTNGQFSRAASSAFLGDQAKENTAIAGMIAEARDRGYWGWQLDFEQMNATDKTAYDAFVAKAYAAFRAKGLVLSVAVVAKVSDNPSDYKQGLWDNLIGVYDYPALAASSDFLSIMAYDDPDSSGAVAPFPWYERVFTYALAHVPNNKISLGIPLYYWQWSDATGKLVGIGGNEGVSNVFAKYAPAVSYDATAQAPVLHYTGLGGVKYTLWYENAKSVAAKLALVTQNHLYGISAWMLGLELPSVYPVLKE